jgi:hypothetical protein
MLRRRNQEVGQVFNPSGQDAILSYLHKDKDNG